MSHYSYVQKFTLTFLFLSLLAVFLCVPSFAVHEPIVDSFWIFQGSQGQTYFPDRDNVYSITAANSSLLPSYAKDYNGLPYGFLISGTDFLNYDETTKSLVIRFYSQDLNFEYGKPYTFELSLYQHPNYTSDQLANASFVFLNGDTLVEVPVDAHITSYGTLSVTFSPTSDITSIEIVLVGHIPRSNRFHCLISPLHIFQSNAADMGGSFSDDTPTLPDIDISSSLDDFENSSSTIGELMSTSIASLMPATRKISQLFSFIYIKVGEYVPALQAVSVLLLSFGVFAVILNIFGFAKSQAGKSSQASHKHSDKGGGRSG